MMTLPHGAAVLAQPDVQARLVFLFALCRATGTGSLVFANVMVAKPNALARERRRYVHHSINGAGLDPAASCSWYCVHRSSLSQVLAWATYLGSVPSRST